MKKILTVIGARPQFIKAAPVSKVFEKSKKINEIIVHTGQHYDAAMSDIFFQELKIKQPLYNLEVGSASHGEQTGKMLNGIEKILIKEKPDFLLVYGDTNSTLAGALAASKLNIPIIHIEAGLRSFNRNMPEEVNRIVTDHLSEYLFTPTEDAIKNLNREGLGNRKIVNVGDVMYDACNEFIQEKYIIDDILKKYSIKEKNYILCTLHRAENTDNLEIFENIIRNLFNISKHKKIIFPMHPRTRKLIENKNILNLSNILFINPVGYIEMLHLMRNANLIITDSGGMQKEGYFLGTQAYVLRSETEWLELIKIGWNRLVLPSESEFYKKILDFKIEAFNREENFYGDGNAAKKICEFILSQ
ncbi:non-hydrolyzing UDP-N-acetylglucosamine 2-epimerase [Fluviispira sanaruensis]|uniref:UDP-N-acetylglucosamine 2-epimerase (Non-hydrolyzing) n=1 Tax=Fluviispira sanaruensis TaxID=2493639 RepID=A0A4P2VQ35_FLUSA|nr:UDP-N-acetylglucosamine 2-epimerase (non-hydrolyzing) [Fluviispira sanaruensis]BBH54049.1 UDP-N-acetylglucosamine 2-epimerase (non-hydrolyzing) [Fluviispira sanaruensis]